MQETGHSSADPRLLSPLTLAFLGDAVYELCARQRIVDEGNRPVNEMHRRTVSLVNAGAQSGAFERISELLTDEELAVYKRLKRAETCGHSRLSPGDRGGSAVRVLIHQGGDRQNQSAL